VDCEKERHEECEDPHMECEDSGGIVGDKDLKVD
jgi:hypothetical protein